MRVRLVDRRAVQRPEMETVLLLSEAERERIAVETRERIERELAAAIEEATKSAERIVNEARESAAGVLEKAGTEAAAITAEAARKGEEAAALAAKIAADDERAKLAGAWLAFRALEAAADDRQIDRVAQLAGVVAERMLGHALQVEPRLVVALAEKALDELRDAQAVCIETHRDDVAALHEALAVGALAELEVVEADIERGSFRVKADLGSVHADLHARIERLTNALRDTLRIP